MTRYEALVISGLSGIQPVEFRQPLPEDAEGLYHLWLNRLADAEPGYQDHSERVRQGYQYGIARSHIEKFLPAIENAIANPERFYIQISTDNGGNEINGYTRAEADPDEDFTLIRGISVREDCQGLGIASRLLDGALDWARTTVKPVRPVRAEIAPGNQRSRLLFTGKNFKRIGITAKGETYTQEAAAGGEPVGIPMLFDVYELGLPALLATQGASRR